MMQSGVPSIQEIQSPQKVSIELLQKCLEKKQGGALGPYQVTAKIPAEDAFTPVFHSLNHTKSRPLSEKQGALRQLPSPGKLFLWSNNTVVERYSGREAIKPDVDFPEAALPEEV